MKDSLQESKEAAIRSESIKAWTNNDKKLVEKGSEFKRY